MTAHSTNFWDRNLGTIVMIIIVLAGQISSYAVLTARVTALEEKTKSHVSISEHDDLIRRVELLEKDMVPRSEHLLRDEQLNIRLTNIESQQRHLQETLDETMTYLRIKHPKSSD